MEEFSIDKLLEEIEGSSEDSQQRATHALKGYIETTNKYGHFSVESVSLYSILSKKYPHIKEDMQAYFQQKQRNVAMN